MAKRDDKHSMTEDYLRQVEWENNHQVDGRGQTWEDEPKWKHKRLLSARKSKGSLGSDITLLIFVISITGYLIFQIFAGHNGKGIVVSILILSMLAILYFISREPQ
jgi:hypothetical protein